MSQLSKIIALEKGVKTRAYTTITNVHHRLAKAATLSGISRTYKPKDDEGEQLPPESTRVQVRATEMLDVVAETLTRLFDVTLTRDLGNTLARADIVVDGDTTIARGIPTSHLLFLEKQLSDLTALINGLPVLDPSETWTYDAAADAYVTPPTETMRSKKVPRNHVKAEATDKHPAQVEMYYEDVTVGRWTTVKASGALPQQRITELKRRVVALAEAVKMAREQANTTDVEDQHIGAAVFGYLLAS